MADVVGALVGREHIEQVADGSPEGVSGSALGLAPLIHDIEFGGLIADKAFDSNWIIEELDQRGAKVVISQRPQRTTPINIDADLYKWRHLIENFFCKLKEFKRIATRADKTDASYAAMINLTAALIHSQ